MLAPPGNAGVEQYLETVPGAAGNHTPRPAGQRAASRYLPPRVRRQLASRGRDGAKLEALVDATASSPAQQSPRQPPAVPQTSDRRDGRLDSLRPSLTDGGDSGGMGILLPVVLGVSTLLLAAVALQRRRRAAG